jgi:hypothetical protein
MMAVRVKCILSICEILPYGVGEKFVLSLVGPVGLLFFVGRILADNFLQENQIGFRESYCLSKPAQNKPPVAPGKPFVDVNGYYS